MDIILDTNVLRSDLLQQSEHFKQLKNYAYKTGASIILPQIVLEELIGLYERELINRYNNTLRAIKDLNAITLQPVAPVLPELGLEKEVSAFKAFLQREIGWFELTELKYKGQYLPELVRRSVKRIKPVSNKGNEFRDTLLWLTILDSSMRSPQTERVFISDNIVDFANGNGDDLHNDLRAELNARGIKLRYYRSVKDFVNDYATPIIFITKEWLIERLDWEYMDSLAIKGVDGINAGFYYEYFYRNVSEDELSGWYALNAKFSRNIDFFWVSELPENGHYALTLFVNGKTKIKFYKENGQVLTRTVPFGTQMSVEIINQEIRSISVPFYEEETGLQFI